ncbi:hypothetical protein COY95_04530 [Candidatus Woesearchaeota archaeon CG_4_10_14_0_8_um_filter_47_5]|nr:MAG: hypothetical protein COY95_04530 [Candidatus Woesearchaeota archaeon CG_4_10_14_0_8_um_filter_47_5]
MEKIDVLNKQLEYLKFRMQLQEHVLFIFLGLLFASIIFVAVVDGQAARRPVVVATVLLLVAVVAFMAYLMIHIKHRIDKIYKKVIRLMETRAFKDTIYN